MVLTVSIPFGQIHFFIHYLKKLFSRFGRKSKHLQLPLSGQSLFTRPNDHRFHHEKEEEIRKYGSEQGKKIIKLAVFASGKGSNAKKLIEYFNQPVPSSFLNSHPEIAKVVIEKPVQIKVVLIVSNKADAGVLEVADLYNIPTLMIEKEVFFQGHNYIPQLKNYNIDYLILAGFLWKIPAALIHAYPRCIINIHPALLPMYGGKGMYGARVHQAVIEGGEIKSGITIHYVDEYYDHGAIIFQAKCTVQRDETVETLSKKIHRLEHEHYGRVIAEVVARK
jgi:folate-dependent phosphoribosylglycinamide formyltransferase PurN